MPYPRKLLNPHEEVAVDLHPHWSYFSQPVAAIVVAIIAGIGYLVIDGEGNARNALGYLALLLLIGSIIWLLSRYAKWATTNFVITNDRLIFRSGVIAKTGIEIPLERVNTVHFNQSVFERMVGAGDLMIESGAEGGQQRFTDVRNPDRVQREIHTQMEANEQRRYSGQPLGGSGGAGSDVASQLEKLEGMLERGTLTREEFQQQKNKLLGS